MLPDWIDGLYVALLFAFCVAVWVLVWALCRSAADGDDRMGHLPDQTYRAFRDDS